MRTALRGSRRGDRAAPYAHGPSGWHASVPVMSLETFLDDATSWAEGREDVVAMALVGSHARGAARADSDIDLSLLCTSPVDLVRDRHWVHEFGDVESSAVEVYGVTRSLRVFYQDGREVEFGIADPGWASVPLDPGTKRVLSDGVLILYDPRGLLAEAVNDLLTG